MRASYRGDLRFDLLSDRGHFLKIDGVTWPFLKFDTATGGILKFDMGIEVTCNFFFS